LVIAAERGELAVVRALIGWGADVTRGANRGDTALIGAARAGHKAIVEALLEAKADPNVANRDGKTALAMAVERRHMAVVDTLLSRGTTPAKDPENSALFAAVETAQTNLIERLVCAGADVNQDRPRNVDSGNNRPATPLEAAVSLPPNRRAGIVRTLLRLGAVPVGTVQNHPVALVGRSTTADPELLKDLIQASSKEQLPEGLLDRLLAEAVRNPGRVDTLPVLLAAGASPNSPIIANETGIPLICLAAETATPRALEILLSAKPDLTAVNHDGQTALHLAALWGKPNNVELLLKAGADPNSLNPSDETPLTYVRQQIARHTLTPQRPAAPGWVQGAVPMPQSGVSVIVPGNAPASLKDYQTTEALLLAHGAREDVVRRLQITAYRGTQQERILRRSGDDPAPRLSDILLRTFNSAPNWSFPQLSALRIDRLQPDGKGETRIEIPADWMIQKDCAWNIPLQWGDAIEIPEEDHVQGQGWSGLPDDAVASLVRCSSRRVTLVIKDETREIELIPGHAQRRGTLSVAVAPVVGNALGGSTYQKVKAPEFLPTCQLWQVLELSRMLRLSSDLTRVGVTRTATSQSWTLDVANDPRARTFWLLDGDRIEVPEKKP
jgi:ankyrin repeat protein